MGVLGERREFAQSVTYTSPRSVNAKISYLAEQIYSNLDKKYIYT